MKNNDIIFKKVSSLLSEGVFKQISYKSKDIIFKEGEPCKKVAYILSGEVEIETLSYNGNQDVISIIHEHEFFGQYLLFQNNGKYLGDCKAKGNLSLVLLSKEELLSFLHSDLSILEAYISMISSDSYLIKQQVKLLSHKNALDRVIYYLENKSLKNEVLITSVSDLAKEINLPRETVSRALTKLEKESFILRDKNKIQLLK